MFTLSKIRIPCYLLLKARRIRRIFIFCHERLNLSPSRTKMRVFKISPEYHWRSSGDRGIFTSELALSEIEHEVSPRSSQFKTTGLKILKPIVINREVIKPVCRVKKKKIALFKHLQPRDTAPKNRARAAVKEITSGNKLLSFYYILLPRRAYGCSCYNSVNTGKFHKPADKRPLEHKRNEKSRNKQKDSARAREP